ncbi:MAG: hypothetical protein ABIH26_03545 [Candidatus Eisenbacteria bacterium]
MSEDAGPGFGSLRVIEGGALPGAPRRVRPRRGPRPAEPNKRLPGGVAEDLSEPVRETTRRIGILLAGDHGPLLEPQREELAAASEAAEFLSALVSLIGLAEREETGRGDPAETFDIRYALWDAVEENAGGARRRRTRLELSLPDRPLTVRAGRGGTRAVLRYAIREHLRNAPRGGRIAIHGDGEAGCVLVRIEPSGVRGGPTRPPRRGAVDLARVLLRRHGADLSFGMGGGWRVRFAAAAPARGDPRPDRGI